MKKQILRLSCCLLVSLIVVGWFTLAQAQVGQPLYRNSGFTCQDTLSNLATNTQLSIPMPSAWPSSTLKKALLTLKLDLGENYRFANVAFTATVRFRLQVLRGNVVDTLGNAASCRFTLQSSKPEGVYYYDLRKAVMGGQPFESNLSTVNSFRAIMDQIQVTVDPANAARFGINATALAGLNASITRSLRITLGYSLDLGIPVTGATLGNLRTSLVEGSKSAVFQWSTQPGHAYVPNYEFQLLRLYNREIPTDNTPLKDLILKEEAISTVLTEADWQKALRLETQSSQTSLRLTLAEGSGYYVWRVRPVGTQFEGGIADARNYGNWTATGLPSGKLEIRRSNLPSAAAPTVFFFRDPDGQLNHSYSRTFTEGNRVSEKVTYASPLQQAKQSQTYLPSQQTRVLSQTMYDHSNRPAVTTLPVPVKDTLGLRGYQTGLVKPLGVDSIYRDRHFDNSNNQKQPTAVQQTGNPWGYYTGKENVPDAEGYPFTRSVFYNDGTNRIKEQSGVGKRHMLGDTAQQMGRTVKTYYGTASDDELVRLFGDEAPASESVLKTLTVDQNHTTTVTYTSKEGKVIATALEYQSQPALAPLDGTTPASINVRDAVSSQSSVNQGLVGGKRLALNAPTTLNITYRMGPCNSATQDCSTTTLDCQYALWVVVSKLDGEAFSRRSGSANYVQYGSGWSFLPAESSLSPDSTVLYLRNDTVSCRVNSNLTLSSLQLPAGTYSIEKRLVLRGQRLVTEASQAQQERKVAPLTHLLKGWLGQVKCDQGVTELMQKLRTLQRDLKNAHTTCNSNANQCTQAFAALDTKYRNGLGATGAFFDRDHEMTLWPDTLNPQKIILSAACCRGLEIPLTFVLPVFDFTQPIPDLPAASTSILVNPLLRSAPVHTKFNPDFEGYAYEFFKPCITDAMVAADASLAGKPYPSYTYVAPGSSDAGKIKYIYYRILRPSMKGWEDPGTFNLMVYHMLKDRYSTDGTSATNTPVLERPSATTNACGQTTDPCIGENCIQYDGETLFKCWATQLGYLRDQLQLCPRPLAAEQVTQPLQVSKGIDQENGSGNKHDNHINTNSLPGGWLMKWFLKRKLKRLAKRVRKMQDSSLPISEDETGDMAGEAPLNVSHQYHAVREFLNCSGYRFAKILTNGAAADAQPLAADLVTPFTYQVPAAGIDSTTQNKRTYQGRLRGYRPDGHWRVITGTGAQADTIFKSVKDPVFAFKYFEYQSWSAPELEVSTCYSDPNYVQNGTTRTYLCLSQPDSLCNFCGIGKVRCTLTKNQWTGGQRYTFYELLNRYRPTAQIDWRDDGLAADDYLSPGYTNTVRDQFLVWNENNSTVYTPGTYSSFISTQLTPATRLQTKVEADISALNRGADSTCLMKRATFRQSLIDTLRARCYVIGGCKMAANDNIVPFEDIDRLVEAMVGECRLRGQTSTFATIDDSCRDIFAPRAATHLGHVDKNGNPINFTRLEYGAGSPTDANCTTVAFRYRAAANGAISGSFTTVNADLLKASGTGQGTTITLRKCDGTLSFREYNYRKEVTETNLFMDVPSKCTDPMNMTMTCTPGTAPSANGNPNVRINNLPTGGQVQGPPTRSAPVSVQVTIKKDGQVQTVKP